MIRRFHIMLKNILVIVNPHSGSGSGSSPLEKLKKAAQENRSELEVITTQSEGHAVEILQKHSLKEIDAVLAIGGDGTINEIVNGLLTRNDNSKIPIGIIPSGTGNSLMQDLGCRNAEEAIKEIFSENRSSLDIFKVEMNETVHYGFNMIGCGLPAAINHYAEASRHFKKQRYNVGALKAGLRYKPKGYTLRTSTGESFISDFIVASNTRHIGSGMKISPEALLDDGKLDVVLLTSFRRLSLIPLFFKLCKGTHLQDEKVIYQQMHTFQIKAPSPSELNIDGEQHEFTELNVRVLPGRIDLLHKPSAGN